MKLYNFKITRTHINSLQEIEKAWKQSANKTVDVCKMWKVINKKLNQLNSTDNKYNPHNTTESSEPR